jgi:hypothetical protein
MHLFDEVLVAEMDIDTVVRGLALARATDARDVVVWETRHAQTGGSGGD